MAPTTVVIQMVFADGTLLCPVGGGNVFAVPCIPARGDLVHVGAWFYRTKEVVYEFASDGGTTVCLLVEPAQEPWVTKDEEEASP